MLKVFSVRDVKVEAYLPPFTMRSKGEALRGFADAVSSKDSALGQHPEDFVLFYLGEFDELTCKFDLTSAPVAMGTGVDFLKVSD